ncbi:helix-turn-helix domain-containing protein [Pedobacter cryoconitis]|uniref:helix-turn-helix domain-containing protein n=1 Tax=Pedobacter cryoconitis TaxID=188932 RepID=UPI001611D8A3|nr:helix-turn-helix domain-containing protein [Pedobacter cryoconitis]MBB5644191.1 AraC-like DNA-binding protein [Pedobacter cryoconitis]
MHIKSYDIIPALQPYVKMICTMECDDDTDTNYIRVLPDACVELFLNYTSTPVAIINNELHQRSIVTFRMSHPKDVQMRKGTGVIAICFYPGMAYKFIQIPMHTLSDTTASLSDIWGCIAAEIENEMAESSNNEVRVNLLQKYLFKKLANDKNDLQIAHCLRQVQLSEGLISVGRLVNNTGLSQRHLSRKFQEYVGLSPKEYLRVSRFILSLDHLKRYPLFSLTEIACKSGYYDQAHFIRDYKDYTGYTPGQVVRASHILY